MDDEKDWKITVAYDNDGYPPVEQGARYVLTAGASLKPEEVGYLALRDSVARQLKLSGKPGLTRYDYITVGVWQTGDGAPKVLALWTARWMEVEDPFGNGIPGGYIHPSGPVVEPGYLGTARSLVDYEEWEKTT